MRRFDVSALLRAILALVALPWLLSSCAASPVDNPSDETSDDTSSGDDPSSSPDDGGANWWHTDAAPLFNQCAAVAVEANLIPANFLFVLDTSGSMNCVPPDGDDAEAELCKTDPRKRGDGPSKWQVTQQALVTALEPLLDRDSLQVAVGVFPEMGSKCGVAEAPVLDFSALSPDHLERTSALLETTLPDGDTPIAGAAIRSYGYLARALRERELIGNTFVVLLTDGNETCKPGELDKLISNDAPMALEGFGIRTFVIGAPGSEEARTLLSQLAVAGGTAPRTGCEPGSDSEAGDCHYDMTRSTNFGADLALVLDKITRTKALSCEFDVPANPEGGGVNLNEVNVTLYTPERGEDDVEPLGKHEGPLGSCDDKDSGWTYSSDRRKILLCGSDCDRIEQLPDAQVRIVLGCPSLDRGQVAR